MNSPLPLSLRASLLAAAAPLLGAPQDGASTPTEWGHSAHGVAYDEGPRQAPWRMEGIGEAPFWPITTSVPEVQAWFDQGNALLHSFWYYEAERAFRWCAKLDPDCAMAYWGLSMCAPYDRERAEAFLAQASERKPLVSARERAWIECWEDAYVADLDDLEPVRPGWNAGSPEVADALGEYLIHYPDDIEAKAYYVLNRIFKDGRTSLEAVLQDVLEVAPEHPGALHYRIHVWDDIELGGVALDSCASYGRVTPAVGHANHMPGHIYTKLGMWHEGAIWLDSATRVEKAYMKERLILPFHAWNYAHNRNYLAHAQSMLGLPTPALQGAWDMLRAPVDPDYNTDVSGYSVFRQGLDALRRTLVLSERWEEILQEDGIPWQDTAADQTWRLYCEALAHVGLGDLERAEQRVLELRRKEGEIEDAAKKADPDDRASRDVRQLQRLFPVMWREAEGRLRIARGDTVEGLRLLEDAAHRELELRREQNDPPSFPRCIYEVLGETYLDLGAPRLAVPAFEKALEVVRHSGFSLAGLARAHHALGDVEAATEAYARMLHVWSDAEPGVWQNTKARALGLVAEPLDLSPAPQRNYAHETLEPLGPNTWQPYLAPALDARDASGMRVTLEQFRGQNVLLVYYLSDQCVHCVEQLRLIEERAGDFADRDTVLLAISADPPERNAEGSLSDLPFRLLSDTADHANAIRWRSYDEFEELELHSTSLLDREGRLRWSRTGGEPFTDLDFLLEELDRIEALDLEPIGMAGAGR